MVWEEQNFLRIVLIKCQGNFLKKKFCIREEKKNIFCTVSIL